MPRNVQDLCSDHFIEDDYVEEADATKMSPKKKKYIIGLSCVGVVLVVLGVLYYFMASDWLKDYSTIGYFTYAYNIGDDTATITKLNINDEYPEKLWIPRKVKGMKVTAIADEALAGADELKEVVMSDNIESIGEKAFYACPNLEKITFSSNLTSVGAYAFDGTAFLENLPNTGVSQINNILLKVGIDYFKPNSILVNDESSPIPEKYKDCSVYYFKDLHEEGLEVPTIWMNGLFNNNDRIVYVEMPDYLDSVPSYAFADCTSLEAIEFPTNVSEIEEYAFQNCTSLVEADIPEHVTTIGQYAFANTSAEIPSDLTHVESIGAGAFQNCLGITEIIYPGSATGVSRVENYCFDGCTNLTSFTFSDPEAITFVGTAAFRGTGLGSFTFPTGVTQIRDYVLSDCPNLTEVKLFDNIGDPQKQHGTTSTVTLVDEDGYEYETEVTSYTTDGAQSICAYSFYNSEKLDTIKLYYEDGTEVGSAGEVHLPSTLTSINNANGATRGYAFMNTAIKSVSLPYGVGTVGQYSFSNDKNLEKVEFLTDEEGNHSVTTLNEGVFAEDTSLETINVPNTLTDLGASCFLNCENLTEFDMSETSIATILAYTFKGCTNLTKTGISSSTSLIYGGAYDGTVSLPSIVIPTTVTRINSDAFINQTDETHTDKLVIYEERNESSLDTQISNQFIQKDFFDETCELYVYATYNEDGTLDIPEEHNIDISGYWVYDENGEPDIVEYISTDTGEGN